MRRTYHATAAHAVLAQPPRRLPAAGAAAVPNRPKQPLAAVTSATAASESSAARMPQASAGVRRYSQRNASDLTKACTARPGDNHDRRIR